MGFLYLFMGVIISSAVLPACLTLLWSGQNKWAAMLSPPLGLICALIAWLVRTSVESGTLNVNTLGDNYPMLAGNVVALCSPCVFVPVLTYGLGRDYYDWKSMAAIRKGDDHDMAAAAGVDLELIPGERNASEVELQAEQHKLRKSGRIAKIMTAVLAVCLIILWPFPMFGSKYIFSKPFFTGWVVVGIIWIFFALFGVGIFPVYEGRKSLYHNARAIFLDITGKQHPSKYHAHGADIVEGNEKSSDAVTTPVSKNIDEKRAESS